MGYMSVQQASKRTGLSCFIIRSAFHKGEIDGVQPKSGCGIRIDRDSLDKWVNNGCTSSWSKDNPKNQQMEIHEPEPQDNPGEEMLFSGIEFQMVKQQAERDGLTICQFIHNAVMRDVTVTNVLNRYMKTRN